MQGEHESSDRAQVARFLKEHVIGKTLVAPLTTSRWDHNQLEVEHESQETLVNFAETLHGFGFDCIYTYKATNYDLDPAGQRILPGRKRDGTRVLRYEFGERTSTGRVTGSSRVITQTIETPSHEGVTSLITGVRVVEGVLIWKETIVGYLDVATAGGKYKPATWDVESRFSLIDGKLQIEFESTDYDVDPDTLARIPIEEK